MMISHECPKALFQGSLDFNDYDYALVHLFDEDPEYLAFYKECVKQGRHVLLDNSIFELGTAYDNDSLCTCHVCTQNSYIMHSITKLRKYAYITCCIVLQRPCKNRVRVFSEIRGNK